MIPTALAAAASDQPDRLTLEEALEWLREQDGAYYDFDGCYWYIESPATRTEYRFRDQLSRS